MKLADLRTKHDELLARAKKLRGERRSPEVPLRQAVLLKLKIMKLEMREERKAA
jgi:hypothetical protein